MLTPMRAMAIIGLGLTGALVHSWVHAPLTLRAPEPDAGKPLDAPPPGPGETEQPGSPNAGGQTDQPAGQNPPDANQGVTPPRVPQTDPQPQAQGQGQPPAQDRPPTPRVFDVRTFGTMIDFEQTQYLHKFVESGQVTFIDARSHREAYEEGHIAGAIHLSAEMFDNADPKADEFMSFYADTERYVIYCSGGDCDESENLRNRLFERGYKVTHIYKDGWNEWVTKPGAPVTTGDQP